jgi:phosphoribosylaminoimidazolecarboxamide formyltransferase/IMP cyclohydrolase
VLTRKKNIRITGRLPALDARRPVALRPISGIGGLLLQSPGGRRGATSRGRDEWRRPGQLDARGRRGRRRGDPGRPGLRLARGARREVQRDPAGRDGASVGIGMGQVNRVDSCHLAVDARGRAGRGSVAASDAFFPFADGPQVLLDAPASRHRAQPGRFGPRRLRRDIEACVSAPPG